MTANIRGGLGPQGFRGPKGEIGPTGPQGPGGTNINSIIIDNDAHEDYSFNTLPDGTTIFNVSNTKIITNNLGNGLSSSPTCMCLVGTDLYIGGFRTVNGTTVNHICKYDTSSANTNNTFTALGSGLDSSPTCMCLVGRDLYIGGYLTTANGTTVNNICKYDTSSANTNNTFTALGSGLNSSPKCMCLVGTDLYIGGYFTTANGTTVNNICKYDTSSANTNNTFTALGSGLNQPPITMCLVGTDLYIGGGFRIANGTTANLICKYDTTSANTNNTFTALGSGLDLIITVMHSVGKYLYIGGYLTTANGTTVNNICKYDTSSANTNNTFTALGSGLDTSPTVMLSVGKYLYIGGYFTIANGTTANRICKYDTSSANTNNTFTALGNGLNSIPNCMCLVGTDLYIGGGFSAANDTITNSNYLFICNGINLIYKGIVMSYICANNPFELIQKNTLGNKEYITLVGSNKKFII